MNISRSLRIPQDLDEKISQFNTNLDYSKSYRFFLELGLKVHQHKTQLERTPQLIQGIINRHLEMLYAAKYGPELENHLKDLDDYKLDAIKLMIGYEEERRKRKAEDERRRNRW